MSKITSIVEDFQLISEIGYELSMSFNNVKVGCIRRAKSTHYLAKTINANFAILSLITGNKYSNKKLPNQDNSSIYSLLRNQIEICNIYWYLIEDEFNSDLFQLKLDIMEYHDTLSSKKVYGNLFQSNDIQNYYSEKEDIQLQQIQSNSIYLTFDKNLQQQIIKGNKSTLSTQFEITQKRNINIQQFKAFYKLLSTYIHSSPTALKNIVANKAQEMDELKMLFLI